METINDLVGYKNKKIYQNHDWFCFSIDSIILARLAHINIKDKKIVDFCSGNIPIPLILSTRTNAQIYAFEIQEEIFELGRKTVKINSLENQVTLINDDVKNSFSYFSDETVDIVTCNPPYFKYDKNSNININPIKSIARHEILINIDEIVESAKKILKNRGRLSIIHTATRFIDVISVLEKYNFGVKRIVPIYTKKDSLNAEIIFVESTKNTAHNVHIEKPIYIYENNGEYSLSVKNMLKE